jgi:hypothetical protein
MAGSRQGRWKEGKNVMKEIKKNIGWQNDTEKLRRRDQVPRLRTSYTKDTYRSKIKRTSDPDCLFCSAKLTLEHILWQCKENEGRNTKE